MATLTVYPALRTGVGVELTGTAAAAGGDAYPNTGQEALYIINAEAAPKTVTIASPALVDGDLTVAAVAFVCPASKTTVLGPFPVGKHNDANGLVQISYSGVTTLTVKVIKHTPV